MTRLRTRAWRQFLLLLLLALFGCGADLSVSLPNDHLLVVANTNDVAIVSRREFGVVVKHSVGRLDTDGDYVFGEIVDPDTRLFTEYFVLDTRTSGAAYYPGQAAWEAALAAAGVSEIDLRAYRVLQRPGPRAGANRTRGGHPDRDPLGVLAKSTISRMRMPTHEHARAMPAERHPLSSRSR